MVDGPGNDLTAFKKLVQDLIDMVEGSAPVLVHCHAGRSRSVTVVAGYLVNTRGWSTQAAYDFIASKREHSGAGWASTTGIEDGFVSLLNRKGETLPPGSCNSMPANFEEVK